MNEPDWLTWTRSLQAIAQTGLAFTNDPLRSRALRRVARPRLQNDGEFHVDASGGDQRPVRTRNRLCHAQNRRARRRVRRARPHPDGARDPGRRSLDAARRMGRRQSDASRKRRQGSAGGKRIHNPRPQTRRPSGTERDKAIRHRPSRPRNSFSSATCPAAPRQRRSKPSAVEWFAEDALPSDMSLGRVLPAQIHRMFAHARDPDLPTEFE